MAFDTIPDFSSQNSFLQQFQSDFAFRTKYIVAGKTDTVFQAISSPFTDQPTFDNLKSLRTTATLNVRRIQASTTLDDNAKLTQASAAQLGFITTATTDLQNIGTTGSAASIAISIQSLATSLTGLVSDYTTGSAAAPNAAKDAQFIATVKQQVLKLGSLLTSQTGRLLDQGVVFSAAVSGARKQLNALQTQLNSVQAAAKAASATTVPPSTSGTGSTVDVTA